MEEIFKRSKQEATEATTKVIKTANLRVQGSTQSSLWYNCHSRNTNSQIRRQRRDALCGRYPPRQAVQVQPPNPPAWLPVNSVLGELLLIKELNSSTRFLFDNCSDLFRSRKERKWKTGSFHRDRIRHRESKCTSSDWLGWGRQVLLKTESERCWKLQSIFCIEDCRFEGQSKLWDRREWSVLWEYSTWCVPIN